ncbi:unnamed protein product [Rhodiola kirilowii]
MALNHYLFSFAFLTLSLLFVSTTEGAYNVVSFGARADGRSDSTAAFLRTWAVACRSARPATIVVPKGRFVVRQIEFRGPCRSRIAIFIYGTVAAPANYLALGNAQNWILFSHVNRMSIHGGTIDANGASYWACRKSGKNCPTGATSMQFSSANNIVVSRLMSINSRMFHFVINGCKNIKMQNMKLLAPDESPNTDGIHVMRSSGVTITGSDIRTGDDCISIGPGSSNLWMENLRCGPGHGVSIGSLAQSLNEEGVQNVTLTNTVFYGTQNGIRIKSWGRQSNGFVRNVLFSNINMYKVKNPIIIDQSYCPSNQGCPHQGLSVKISSVTYKNIKGTSATPVAVKLHCSRNKPCSGMRLEDIKLTYGKIRSLSSCQNIHGTSSRMIAPLSCF